MSLKLTYYGQNDSVNCTPAVFLTGDPGTDQQTLTSAGYLGGVIVAIIDSAATLTAYGAAEGNIPFATLLNGPGEFSGSIGPSGSRKAPVVRALWQGNVDFQGYDALATFHLGQYVYAGGTVNTNIGKYTSLARKGAAVATVGICTHVPSATEPWLGVASLL